MKGILDMNGNRISEIPVPTHDKDATNKLFVEDAIYNGFTMNAPIGMANHKIYDLKDPTHEKDATNKKYVDAHRDGVFNDGTTFTSQIDIRRVLGSIGIFEDVTFHSGAYSQDTDTSSPQNAVVNKGALQTEGLVGLNSLEPSLKALLSTLQEQKFDANISLLVLKGKPGTSPLDGTSNFTVLHKDSKLVNSVSFRKVGNDTRIDVIFKKNLDHGIYSYEFDVSSDRTGGFDIYMYGECGGTGFNAETLYRYWSSTEFNTGKDFNPVKQAKTQGGFFHRGSGKKVQFFGSFRYTGGEIVNRGKPFSINTDTNVFNGRTYEFLIQKLTLDTSATTTSILGASLVFIIEPDSNHDMDLESDSYFSITKNVALTV